MFAAPGFIVQKGGLKGGGGLQGGGGFLPWPARAGFSKGVQNGKKAHTHKHTHN